MIKSIAVGFCPDLISVQAKSPAALHHQPDGMITQIPEACGLGRVRSVASAWPEPQAPSS
jgi:hypothetical protein